jgi:hypothetical protein
MTQERNSGTASHDPLLKLRSVIRPSLTPLLQIAPSTTDEEQLLVVSPELADVPSTIVSRVRRASGAGGGGCPANAPVSGAWRSRQDVVLRIVRPPWQARACSVAERTERTGCPQLVHTSLLPLLRPPSKLPVWSWSCGI